MEGITIMSTAKKESTPEASQAVTKEAATENPVFSQFSKVGDFTEAFKGLSGIVKENFMIGFETFNTFLAEKQKFTDSQLDYALSVQKEFSDNVKKALKDIPNNEILLTNLDNVSLAQKEYIGFYKNFSQKAAKDSLAFTQKSTEQFIDSFEVFISNFK